MAFRELVTAEHFEKSCDEIALSILIDQFDSNEENLTEPDKLTLRNIKARIDEGPLIPWTKYSANRLYLQHKRGNHQAILLELLGRYRYDCAKNGEEIKGEYPPLVQIEVTSKCNYRCVFCYQTDDYFNKISSKPTSIMSFELFKKIVDEIEGNVPYITLASRGEPLINRELGRMLNYAKDKFLDLKINTNASLLNEKNSDAILDSCTTIVFSIDAEEKETYEKLRVNGNFDKTVANIKTFAEKLKRHPRRSLIRTRASGVYYGDKNQDFDSYSEFFGSLVDEASFVQYNPWEKIYSLPTNHNTKPCTQMDYRFFIWSDGTFNVCDMDYKGTLCMDEGVIGSPLTVKDAWTCKRMNQIREIHKCGERGSLDPCQRCPL